MKIKKIELKEIKEETELPFRDVTSESIDSDNFIIKNTCLFGTRKSANSRIYQDKAIGKLAELAEGVKCFINHPSKQETKERDGVRDLRDWVGVYKNARRSGERIFADLFCREAYWDLAKDVALLSPSNVGNSINAVVRVVPDDKGMESVVDAERLFSVDLVSSAATTQNLFESAIDKNVALSSELSLIDIALEVQVERLFEQHMVAEGIIKDAIDSDKLRNEISDVTWTANSLIEKILYSGDKMAVDDKKKKVVEIFDDLAKEVKARMDKMKSLSESKKNTGKEITEKMELTLEMVKGDKSIMEALLKEFRESIDMEKIKAELSSVKEQFDEVKKEKDASDKKISTLEAENQSLKLKLDEYSVKEKKQEKDRMIEEAVKDLPKEAKTDVFMETLQRVEDIMEDGKVKTSAKEQIQKLVDDRKSIFKGKSVVKESGTENKQGFGDDVDSAKSEPVKESDVDNFVSSLNRKKR